jgi:muconolactone delta-isomerase
MSRQPALKTMGRMPRIVITHAIQDVDRWLGGKSERAGALQGATGLTDLVAMDGSNSAAVTFDVDDVEGLQAMLASLPPEVAAQAESHGVIMPMTVYVEA